MGISSSFTNTDSQTLFYAPNVGCIKIVDQSGVTVFELIGGVIGTVSIGGENPTVTITSPANGATVTGSALAVQGTATVSAAVYCRVGGGSWSMAQGTANWTFQAFLSPGANVIEAYPPMRRATGALRIKSV